MKIALGNDHAGIDLKIPMAEYLTGLGYEIVNFGTDDHASVDYPHYAKLVAESVVSGECDLGILFCGTGIGMSMAANKVRGIRAAVCTEPYSARLTRQHNNANILCLGSRVVGVDLAKMIIDEFLGSEYQGGRHQRRVDMITAIEEER